MAENSRRTAGEKATSQNNINNDGLRNRRPATSDRGGNGDTLNRKDAATASLDTDKNAAKHEIPADAATLHPRFSNKPRNNHIVALAWIVHVAAIACFVAGIVLRTSRLHTGEECDMTWSVRVFLEVETATSIPEANPGTKQLQSQSQSLATNRYRLYKFFDQRDPRYSQILRQPQQRRSAAEAEQELKPLGRNGHCRLGQDSLEPPTHKNIVVYVPGHWGTYEQARSLGAHGIGLTRARESSKFIQEAQQRMVASSSGDGGDGHSEKDFVYDVYAVDFAEQGGALHGQFLRYQSEFLAGVLRQLSEDCGLSEGSESITVVAHSMGGYVARMVLLDHPELPVENLVTLATPHSNPLYSFDRSVSDFHRKLLEGSNPTGKRETSEDPTANTKHTNESTSTAPLVVSISGGLRDEMIEPSACRVVDYSAMSSRMGYFPSAFLSAWMTQGASETVATADTPHSWTVLATKLVANSNANSNSNSAEEKFLLGMDHRAIVWCHQLLEEVHKVLWILMASSEGVTAQERLDRVRNAIGSGSGSGNGKSNGESNGKSSGEGKGDREFGYVDDLNELKQGIKVEFGSWQAICMEASMIYNLPYLLALYSVLVGLRCARITPTNRVASLLPIWATVLLGWTLRSDLSWLATVILVLVANAFNLALVYGLPVGFLLRRRKHRKVDSGGSSAGDKKKTDVDIPGATAVRSDGTPYASLWNEKEPKRPLHTLWHALVQTLAVLILVIFGGLVTCRFLPGLDHQNFAVHNWLGVLDSLLYTYTIATIYVMLVVWVGFIDNDRNRRTIDNSHDNNTSAESFEIQLIAFIIIAVPFLVAGPLVLMVWEQRTQRSSWWTLLSLQVPVAIRVFIKLSRMKMTEPHGQRDGDAITTRERGNLSQSVLRRQQLGIRSILIYLSVVLRCYGESGLLSPGAGYLVPNLGMVLVWIDIVSSLLVGYP